MDDGIGVGPGPAKGINVTGIAEVEFFDAHGLYMAVREANNSGPQMANGGRAPWIGTRRPVRSKAVAPGSGPPLGAWVQEEPGRGLYSGARIHIRRRAG